MKSRQVHSRLWHQRRQSDNEVERLENHMGCAVPVSRLIDRLQNNGLARRKACAEDGRGNRIFIEPAGEALLKQMWPVYAQTIRSQFEDRLQESDLIALSKALVQVLGSDPDKDRS